MELREFTCKCCTAPLDIGEAVGRAVRCKYCGTVFLLAREDEGKVADLLRSAELLLDTCKFDEAYTAYAKAAELDSEEPEAYFGMALAAFKVQYLKDEVNERLQPICHEISEKVFSDDKNFRRALELATDEQKREYRKRGREIDEIKEEFYDLQRKGLDYDCFLCVKVTEEDGRTRTADYDRANDIYYYLKDEGYKPFFSEREMKGRTGADYEALILYALYRSECMLIVCSDESYLKTKWVKNEYTRFLHMLANEEKERDAISFAFYGTPVEKLPNGKKVQGIDLSKPDAYSRIGNFVEVHTPEAKKKREEERATTLPANLSPEQLLAMMRQAEEEEERKKEEENRAYLAQFEIENGALKKYKGKGGEVVIPNGVTSIENGAFDDCDELTSLTIPNSVIKIGSNVFDVCGNPEEIHISDLAAWCRVDLGDHKLEEMQYEDDPPDDDDDILSDPHRLYLNGKEITNLVIPEGVTEIKQYVFQRCCEIKSVIIPNTVTEIGAAAFYGCNRSESIDEKGGVERVTIGDGVSTIRTFAFGNCTELSKIAIGRGVKTIESFAFVGCDKLTSITIPDSVTEIGYVAFANCSGLKHVTIPHGVSKIGFHAFFACGGLESVTISKGFKGGIASKGLKYIFGENYKKIKFTFTK